MKSALLLVISLASACLASRGQIQPPAEPKAQFEAASVRLSSKDFDRRSWNSYPANRIYYHNETLDIVLADAFHHDNTYIIGPQWLKEQCYVIDAKVEGEKLLSREEVRPLLRTLLEQRFHLAVHHETRMVSGYALTAAKGKLQLRTGKPDDPYFGYIFTNLIRGSKNDLAAIADTLSVATGSPVVNKSGIQGFYMFDLHYSTADHPDPNLPDLFTAVQEQLGLKLEPQKVPVDYLVIDNVDKIPTEN